MDFPERLRTLRKLAQLSQRDLAERVGVDFTYLSKIENRRADPPSEAVLRGIAKELAEALGENEIELADGLITLAGKIPSDLAETLSRNPEAVRFLRSIGDEVWPSEVWRRLMGGRRADQPGQGATVAIRGVAETDGRPAGRPAMTTKALCNQRLWARWPIP